MSINKTINFTISKPIAPVVTCVTTEATTNKLLNLSVTFTGGEGYSFNAVQTYYEDQDRISHTIYWKLATPLTANANINLSGAAYTIDDVATQKTTGSITNFSLVRAKDNDVTPSSKGEWYESVNKNIGTYTIYNAIGNISDGKFIAAKHSRTAQNHYGLPYGWSSPKIYDVKTTSGPYATIEHVKLTYNPIVYTTCTTTGVTTSSGNTWNLTFDGSISGLTEPKYDVKIIDKQSGHYWKIQGSIGTTCNGRTSTISNGTYSVSFANQSFNETSFYKIKRKNNLVLNDKTAYDASAWFVNGEVQIRVYQPGYRATRAYIIHRDIRMMRFLNKTNGDTEVYISTPYMQEDNSNIYGLWTSLEVQSINRYDATSGANKLETINAQKYTKLGYKQIISEISDLLLGKTISYDTIVPATYSTKDSSGTITSKTYNVVSSISITGINCAIDILHIKDTAYYKSSSGKYVLSSKTDSESSYWTDNTTITNISSCISIINNYIAKSGADVFKKNGGYATIDTSWIKKDSSVNAINEGALSLLNLFTLKKTLSRVSPNLTMKKINEWDFYQGLPTDTKIILINSSSQKQSYAIKILNKETQYVTVFPYDYWTGTIKEEDFYNSKDGVVTIYYWDVPKMISDATFTSITTDKTVYDKATEIIQATEIYKNTWSTNTELYKTAIDNARNTEISKITIDKDTTNEKTFSNKTLTQTIYTSLLSPKKSVST